MIPVYYKPADIPIGIRLEISKDVYEDLSLYHQVVLILSDTQENSVVFSRNQPIPSTEFPIKVINNQYYKVWFTSEQYSLFTEGYIYAKVIFYKNQADLEKGIGKSVSYGVLLELKNE